MFGLKDILELLDRWPAWKKITEAPSKIEALENRISELEKRLARCPGEGCPRCGELTFRVHSTHGDPTFGVHGVSIRTLKCEKCGFEENKRVGA